MESEEKLDIAIFPGTLSRGGAERVSVRLAEYFSSVGNRTAIMVERAHQENDYPLPDGVQLFCASESSVRIGQIIIGYRRLIKKHHPRTILVMGTPLCCTVLPAALFTGSKIVVSERNSPEQFAGRKTTKILMRFWMRFADGYVFQTEEAKNYYSSRIKRRGEVIPNPILAKEIPNRKTPISNEIVGVGRLNPQKNWPLLIRAFSDIAESYPELKLVIYGEGEQREELECLIGDLGLEEKVWLPGTCDNVLERECAARIFVLPSNFEGMPNALMEAMAIGMPCIVTDCPSGGPAELIEHEVNGMLVPVGDEEELKKAIQKLIEDSIFANEIGFNAKYIRDKYSIIVIGNRWLKYISKLLARN